MKLTPNMHEVEMKNGTVILFSYKTPVAAKLPDGGYVKTTQKYSSTTSSHISRWCPKNAKPVSQRDIDALLEPSK